MRTKTEWPLTGRHAELKQVLDALEAGSGVVLIGAPGVGKSRLAAEVTEVLGEQGVATRRVSASPTTTAVPFAALSALIGSAPPRLAVAAAAEALRGGGEPGAVPVLHVDDAHLLDDASAAAVQQLVGSGQARVLLTVRSGEPLAAPLRSAWSDGGLQVVVVQPLGAEEAATLVTRVLGGPVDGRTVHRLITTSKGNVLFLRELVEGSLADGALRERGGLWGLRGRLARTPLVEHLIDARLGPLDAGEREVAELLALSGPVGLDLLGCIADLAAAERLERQGLLLSLPGRAGVVELAHPLYTEALLDQLPALTRLRLSRLLAEAADAVGPEAAGGELRVVLWRRAGGLDTGPERLLPAAFTAFDAGDTRLAAELAIAAAEAGASVEATLLAASSLSEYGDSARAIELVRAAAERAVAPDDVGHLTLRLAEELWWTNRDRVGALARCAEAMQALPTPWPEVMRAEMGVLAVLDGRATEALADVGHLVDHPEPLVARNAGIAVALALLLTGRPVEGADLSASVAEATSGQLPRSSGDVGIHVITRGFCLAAAGDLAEARAMGELVYAAAASQPGLQARGWAATLAGEVAFRAGDVDGALRLFTEGEQAWAEATRSGPARWAAAMLAIAYAHAGRTEEAADALARSQAFDGRGFTMLDSRLDRARGWVAYLTDGPAVGIEVAAVAARAAHAAGLDTAASELARDLLSMGDGPAAAAVLDALHARGPMADRWADLAHAVEAGDAARLEAQSFDLEAIGALLDAAEAAGHAARVHRRAGAAKDALRCATRSGEIAARCPGAATPLLQDRGASAELSGREHEVAGLAAAGLTNRAIAEQIFVAERTVENHLYRIFAKLGISSRAELAARLADALQPAASRDGRPSPP